MSVGDLIALIGPNQRLGSAIDWSRLEKALATSLPADYKVWVDHVGAGCLSDFVWVLVPNCPNRWLDFEATEREFASAYGDLRQQHPSLYVEKIFPEPGGLLPWGRTDNGNYLLWRTLGEPDSWSVVVLDSRGPEFEEFPVGAMRFLFGYLRGDVSTNLLPNDLGEVSFSPER